MNVSYQNLTRIPASQYEILNQARTYLVRQIVEKPRAINKVESFLAQRGIFAYCPPEQVMDRFMNEFHLYFFAVLDGSAFYTATGLGQCFFAEVDQRKR